jgi:hypothetical protein
VTGLDKLEEAPSLLRLRDHVLTRLPRIDLPELLLEIHTRTGFAHAFTHISEGTARVADLPLSLCAVLLAEACNIGLEPVIRSDVPALTRGRLSWVQQNYFRAETLTRANACLVDFQATLPLAQAWGGGEVASADGLRFVVPVRTINAGPNRKYFNADRDVTYYNFTSNQFTGFHAIVIPGTRRDSMYILDGLLEHQTQPDFSAVARSFGVRGIRVEQPGEVAAALQQAIAASAPVVVDVVTALEPRAPEPWTPPR